MPTYEVGVEDGRQLHIEAEDVNGQTAFYSTATKQKDND
jgi:hypothetical protein